MTTVDEPTPVVPTGDATSIAGQWLRDFTRAMDSVDLGAVELLFLSDGWWRDLLSVTWDFRTLHGMEAIQEIAKCGTDAGLTKFALTKGKTPQVVSRDPSPESIEAFFDFETRVGQGRGVVRLTLDVDGMWKAWTLLTTLQDLHGHEQARRTHRPAHVPENGASPGDNWSDWRQRASEFTQSEPQVVVVGSGHGGLAVAANLSLFGIDTLIIEQNARIGDNWRMRYHSLVLHDPIWADHLPYLPFPESWPVHTPKDKLADWLELYAVAMDLNFWTGTQILDSSYDDARNVWTLQVRRSDGTVRTLHPAHVVLATGVHGETQVPQFEGMKNFGGRLLHSSEYTGGDLSPGTRAIVVGAGNSGHDIAEDLHRSGADVTLIQRSSTYVMTQKNGLPTLFGSLFYEGGPPVEDADLLGASFPYSLALERAVHQTRVIADMDRDLLEGLKRAGFRTDLGINGGGGLSKILFGPGSYYLDVGCSQLIADGKVKVAHASVERLTETGIIFDDGARLDADIVVFATGYKSMRETARRLFGDELADRCDPLWGLNSEGEINSMWRNSGHPGFWFMGGPLYIARFYSRYLALQIQALERGIFIHPAVSSASRSGSGTELVGQSSKGAELN